MNALASYQELGWKAIRFETPPLSQSDDPPFEFAIVNSPGLDGPADISPFTEPIAKHCAPGSDVCAFSNLGGDCQMVVPLPNGDEEYSHLAKFIEVASKEHQQRLWRMVAEETLKLLASRPDKQWLSTAGGGVAWLHVRLDNTPKYYSYTPYRSDAYKDLKVEEKKY